MLGPVGQGIMAARCSTECPQIIPFSGSEQRAGFAFSVIKATGQHIKGSPFCLLLKARGWLGCIQEVNPLSSHPV